MTVISNSVIFIHIALNNAIYQISKTVQRTDESKFKKDFTDLFFYNLYSIAHKYELLNTIYGYEDKNVFVYNKKYFFKEGEASLLDNEYKNYQNNNKNK